jgi:hypothetical protein
MGDARRRKLAGNYPHTTEAEMKRIADSKPEYDGSMKLSDYIVQAAMKRIAESGLVERIDAGKHEWVLNMELSANRAGSSLLRPLRDFKVIVPVCEDVAYDRERGKQIETAVESAGKDASLLGAILTVLEWFGIVSPKIGRNSAFPMCTELTGETHMIGLVISEDMVVFL